MIRLASACRSSRIVCRPTIRQIAQLDAAITLLLAMRSIGGPPLSPVTGRSRSRKAHSLVFSLACSLVGQIHGVYERERHVRDLLATDREVIQRIALDGESVPVSL